MKNISSHFEDGFTYLYYEGQAIQEVVLQTKNSKLMGFTRLFLLKVNLYFLKFDLKINHLITNIFWDEMLHVCTTFP